MAAAKIEPAQRVAIVDTIGRVDLATGWNLALERYYQAITGQIVRLREGKEKTFKVSFLPLGSVL